MKRVLWAAGVVFLVAIAGSLALRLRTSQQAQSARSGLILYCGAGIRPAADALIEAFEKRSGIRVNATYAGSGALLGQISASRKGDLFMPGAEFYVEQAIAGGLAERATHRTVAHFIPVIFVQKGNPRHISSLDDLMQPGLRVGFGDERAAAIGKTTQAILRKNGIAPGAMDRNVVFRSGTVNELGVAVRLGSVDAVIVWDTEARHFADAGTAVPIPPERNVPAAISIVRLKASDSPRDALSFITFVASPEGRQILAGQGYNVASTQETNP